jgi:4-hydroxythreonine-4-phosphate dehydrogenase
MALSPAIYDDFNVPSDSPRVAVSLGDPAGIGPEVVLKALATLARDASVDLRSIVLFGTTSVLKQALDHLATKVEDGLLPRLEDLTLHDVPLPQPWPGLTSGQESAATGAASFAYLKTAIEQTVAGQFDAIVTAPIAKSAWKAAGHDYPGQTELLAEGAGVRRFAMAFVAESPYTGWQLRTLLATTHIPLRQVPDALTPGVMTTKLDLLIECLQRNFGIPEPRIAVAGLNPHSGEGGQLGQEELEWLIPWLEHERTRYPKVQLDGPIPADTLWVRPGQAWFGTDATAAAATHDGYLALYHDQGLIPVKLMGFDRAVNTTIGLPFIRTSPDHGTAFDIAGQGVAKANSMVAALKLAIQLAHQRHQTADPGSR